ncbi:hypothetical protein S40293_11467 [Stachybotrys chartarum IBT 40293]|nr:hypothetical protein S40293_11467 [Stachybotrys chartarum IBT 40293]
MAAYPNANQGFPPLSSITSPKVTAEERISSTESVNRVNLLFEEFDKEKMRSTFLPDASVEHAYVFFRGTEEMMRFIEEDYPPLIPGAQEAKEANEAAAMMPPPSTVPTALDLTNSSVTGRGLYEAGPEKPRASSGVFDPADDVDDSE